MNDKARAIYNAGWQDNGEWHCSQCRTMIGKNLLGDRPFALAREHAIECEKKRKELDDFVKTYWNTYDRMRKV